MPRLPAIGTLLLGFWLGALGRTGSTLVAVVGVAGVEVSLLEGTIDGVENQSVESVLLEVFLNGKDARFLNGAPNWPGFIAKQLLGFSGVFCALSHCVRILFQDLGLDFARKKVGHESHANLVEEGFMDRLLSGVALLGHIASRKWRRGIRQRQDLADHFEGVDDFGVELVQVLESVGSLPDTEHGVDEDSGTAEVPEMGELFLFQVGPCLAMLLLVEDGSVGRGSLGDSEEGRGGVGIGHFIGPVQGVSHSVDAGTPVDDSQRVLVRFGVEYWDFFLIDLHYRILCCSGDWSDGET